MIQIPLLSQVAPTLPDVSWWQNYGPLGIIALIVAAGIVTYFWWLHFPYARSRQQQELKRRELELKHLERKQELETVREEKLNGFIDKLNETHSAEVEFKRQIAVATTEIAKTQAIHAEDCASGRAAIERVEQRISRAQ